MNEIIEKENSKIEDMIFEVRGKQVILASDVAKLYNSETKIINQVVKRNKNRFPEDFCFQLNEKELTEICSRSQIVTLNTKNNSRGHNIKYLPYVFTEHGVMMLAGLLKSDIAAKVNVAIINAFVAMRQYISNSILEQRHYKDMLLRHDEEIKLLQNTFSKFDTFSNEIFFEGQIWDAHSLLLDIFNKSHESITIIDNYISKELLDVLSKTDKQITIYTRNIDKNMINKYQSQYKNIIIKINNSIHYRFIIIDNNTLYHCGASFKDLGKKCFAISKMENNKILKELIIRL